MISLITWMVLIFDIVMAVKMVRRETARLWRMRAYTAAIIFSGFVIGAFFAFGFGLSSRDDMVHFVTITGVWAICLTNIVYACLERWISSSTSVEAPPKTCL